MAETQTAAAAVPEMIYGRDDVPPWRHMLALSAQHLLFMFAASAFPAVLAREIGGSTELAAAMVSMTMIAAGIGSVIQGSRFGSGYLCPNLCGPSYLGASLHAAWVGGIPVMRGMIILAGLVEMSLAPVVRRLRTLFPPLVVGLVVMMVGVSVVNIAVSNFFGVSYSGDEVRVADIAVGAAALLIMVGANIWGTGWVRMYCLLIGTGAGWLLALTFIPESWSAIAAVRDKPLLDLPLHDLKLLKVGFDLKLAPLFIIVAVCGSLKSFGNLLAAQRISEPPREEPDLKPVTRGLLADGFTTVLAGAMGALAVDTSSSNVGLAAATRAVSRWISVCAGVLFTLMAFMPAISAAVVALPRPVLGASLIFAGSFMICTGFQQMLEKGFDSRAVFTVGISLFFGLSTGFLPDLYAHLPMALQQFFTDPLATTTLMAVVLHQVFRLDALLKPPNGEPPNAV